MFFNVFYYETQLIEYIFKYSEKTATSMAVITAKIVKIWHWKKPIQTKIIDSGWQIFFQVLLATSEPRC